VCLFARQGLLPAVQARDVAPRETIVHEQANVVLRGRRDS